MRYIRIPAPIDGMLVDAKTSVPIPYFFSGYLIEFVYSRSDIFRDSNDGVESMQRLVRAFGDVQPGVVVELEGSDYERLKVAACTGNYGPAIVVPITCNFVHAITSARAEREDTAAAR